METIEFNKKMKCGADFVAVTVLDTQEDLKIGNVYLPDSVGANGRLAHCRVDDVGTTAAEKLGIKPGDYILIDRLATFAWTAPKAALKYDSVICLSNEKKTECFPLKDCMFIEPDAHESITDVGGFYVKDYDRRLNTGTVVKTNFEKTAAFPFEPGQKVMLVKRGDAIEFGERMYHSISKDMVVCTVED